MENDKAKEEENFIKENQILFKKYRLKKKLAEGAFGDVYIGTSISTKEPVAIKIEPRKIAKPLLEAEAYFLFQLRGLGIPEVLSFGRKKSYNILIEPLLGKSLFDIFNERRKHMALEDICLISKQIIDRIQWVHSKGFVHRDIKPDNFLIGRKDPNVIYLIDFGLSKKYKSDKTGKHLKFNFTGKLTGTVRFASANALRGGEQSRKDDLESIAYMIIFFMRGKLPWQGVTGTKKMERYLKIYKMKKNVTPEDLCKSLPPQMAEFTKYVKQLEFEQEPDYNYLRSLFNSILKQRKKDFDTLTFSWIKYSDMKNFKNPINPATRKDSPQGRLYKKIQDKLNRERNNSSDNDSGEKTFLTTNNISAQNKEENVTSKDEAEIEENNYKSKKYKSKEGLNTLEVNINKTLDEKVNFEDTVKKEKKDDIKKKNYTVNDKLDFKSEKKLTQIVISTNKNNDIIRDKSEEIRLSNQNERKMSLMKIDEKEEQTNENVEEKNENKNKEINEEKKDNNKIINNNDKNNIDLIDNEQKIIPIKKSKIKTNSIIDDKNQQTLNNNLNLIEKNIHNLKKNSDSPEKIEFNNNISRIKNEKEKEINENVMKLDKKQDIDNVDNMKNIIQIQKKTSSPNKFISQIRKGNDIDNLNKVKKGVITNKNIEINNKINKAMHMNKENKNNQNKIKKKFIKKNIKIQKLNIEQISKKLITENDEGPIDNNRKKFIQSSANKIYRTEIKNFEINEDSSKNLDKFHNNIKIQYNNKKNERRKTPNNTMNMNRNIIHNNKNNTTIYENQQNFGLDILPHNSDEFMNNLEYKIDNEKIDFNKDNNNLKVKKLSNSLNLFQNNDNFNNNNINDNNKNIININLNNRRNDKFIAENNNNNLINNNMSIHNNTFNKTNANNIKINNVEFNKNNRQVRIVGRKKNQAKKINPNGNNSNIKPENLYNNTFTNFNGNINFNSTYNPHNININNNISNNIIINNNINNKYPQPMNSSVRSNSNNHYLGPNIMQNNFILTKRPSQNMDSSKMWRSFNMMNVNPIQYRKRASYNSSGQYINNSFNPMKGIIVTKRPSCQSNISVSSMLNNNTEPNSSHIGFSRTRKILNSNNIKQNISLKGKNIEIIRDNKDLKINGEFGIDPENTNNQLLKRTYENNMPIKKIMINQYKIENNINNNIMINKGNNLMSNQNKIINLSDKIPMNQLVNVNNNINKNFGNNNKIMIEKIQNYNSYENKIGNYQNINNQFNNNAQFYGTGIY